MLLNRNDFQPIYLNNMKGIFAVIGMIALFLVGPVQAQVRAVKTKTEPRAKQKVLYTREVREATSGLRVAKGRWQMIIAHHSGTRDGNAATYDREHRRRGMENGLAYHFVIGNGVDSADGKIEIGQRWLKQIKGGHVRSDKVNETAIGICLVGNLDQRKPTRKQAAALRELLAYLRDEVVGRQVKFVGHREADPGHTACPGRYFPRVK
jgi:N-acetyl-anhydromuramyl-L-alanine amidase AmpD